MFLTGCNNNVFSNENFVISLITPFFSLLIEDILDKLEDTVGSSQLDSEEEAETSEVSNQVALRQEEKVVQDMIVN